MTNAELNQAANAAFLAYEVARTESLDAIAKYDANPTAYNAKLAIETGNAEQRAMLRRDRTARAARVPLVSGGELIEL